MTDLEQRLMLASLPNYTENKARHHRPCWRLQPVVCTYLKYKENKKTTSKAIFLH